jgi:hypothetical protein
MKMLLGLEATNQNEKFYMLRTHGSKAGPCTELLKKYKKKATRTCYTTYLQAKITIKALLKTVDTRHPETITVQPLTKFVRRYAFNYSSQNER